ncbi:MAG TPA: hypothetical protein PKD37_00420 [Oligoflexia bacterium]|nr:hypothetical protein [Oligoflexia bacterium]HMP26444.1 hypothetical protein [Oligoflexia bacterium]
MVEGKFNFILDKGFAKLELVPEASGLRLLCKTNSSLSANSEQSEASSIDFDIRLPIEAIGSLWATARAFLYGVEALDENIILEDEDGSDLLIKLYRDRPKGKDGKLTGEELCWLRIVAGRSEDDRRRFKLGMRDLIMIDLACNAVLLLSR